MQMALEVGDLVYTLDSEGYAYYAFVYEVSIPGTSYQLLYSNAQLAWVAAAQVGKLLRDDLFEVQDVEREAQPASGESSEEEVLASIPLDDEEPPRKESPPPSTTGPTALTRAPPTQTDLNRETPADHRAASSRRKRIKVRVKRRRNTDESGSGCFACFRAKNYESI